MLSNGEDSFTYDSANRLITADGHTYTYSAENVRIRNLCTESDTTYVYDTNARLSRLLTKTTNGTVTKYVYGRGLIGEQEECDCDGLKIYHFDYRGSTVAITDIDGSITDTFKYDTYGKLISRTGTTDTVFMYNGRDGVVTDSNGLIYMRARYYSPDMRRFINADIVPGKLSNAITLNRYAYANGNPVSFVDPFGLSAERGETSTNEIEYGSEEYINALCQFLGYAQEIYSIPKDIEELAETIALLEGKVKLVNKDGYIIIKGSRDVLSSHGIKQTRIRADNIKKFKGIDELYKTQTFKGALKNSFDAPGVLIDAVGIVATTVYEVNQYESDEDKRIIGTYTAGTEIISTAASAVASAGATALATKIGTMAGTAIAPGVGTAIGLAAGFIVGTTLDLIFKHVKNKYILDIVENN